MATSSITKRFVVKDLDKYIELLKELDEISDDTKEIKEVTRCDELEQGCQLIDQFLFR